MVVYVDDFKMSGPAANLPTGWGLISKGIKIDVPEDMGTYLGCQHVRAIVNLTCGSEVRCLLYDMKLFS